MFVQKQFDTKNNQKQYIRIYTKSIVLHEKTIFSESLLQMKVSMILDIQRKLDQSLSSIQSILVFSVSPDDGINERK